MITLQYADFSWVNWMRMTLDWKTESLKGNRRRRHAICHATESDLLQPLSELWLTLFEEQMRWYALGRWNSVLGVLQPWHGTIDLELTLDGDVERQLPGCGLYLESIHGWLESATTDDEFENRTSSVTQLCLGELEAAFSAVVSDASVQSMLVVRAIPFSVILEPDEPPVLEMLLQQ